MSKHQILIVTSRIDPHADAMILTLKELGHTPIRLNTEDIPLHTALSMRLDGADWHGTIRLQTNARVADIDQIRSIWWRRPGMLGLPPDLSPQERAFAQEEIGHVLSGLWASLDCYWMSFPANIRQASWKVEQLKRAAALGFEVPRTLITSDPAAARAFFEECHGQIIFKVLSDSFLGLQAADPSGGQAPPASFKGARTTLITADRLDLLDLVALVPCQFQEYIPKRVELRVTVIGDELFAAEIHSQAHEKTRVDWRNYDVTIPYHKATLPPDVADRCMTFVRSYGLNYSALDLIVTPDGRYVFIENNPNGQFMFVEELVPELKLRAHLAACLIRGANS
ncbi:MAG TPA: hypothetical protein VFZ66_18815 [Herpetosiphonaceae bacterium]